MERKIEMKEEKNILKKAIDESSDVEVLVMDDRCTIPHELPPVTEEDEKFFEQIIKECGL